MEKTTAIARMKEQVRLQQWQAEICERQESGISVKEWCMERGLSPSAYYHRLRRIRETLCREIAEKGKTTEKPEVVPIKAVSAPTGNIEIASGEIRITVNGSVSPDCLESVIRALKSC